MRKLILILFTIVVLLGTVNISTSQNELSPADCMYPAELDLIHQSDRMVYHPYPTVDPEEYEAWYEYKLEWNSDMIYRFLFTPMEQGQWLGYSDDDAENFGITAGFEGANLNLRYRISYIYIYSGDNLIARFELVGFIESWFVMPFSDKTLMKPSDRALLVETSLIQYGIDDDGNITSSPDSDRYGYHGEQQGCMLGGKRIYWVDVSAIPWDLTW